MKTPTLLNIRILLTILMLGMGSSVWADEVVYTLTADGVSAAGYETRTNATINGIEWGVPGYVTEKKWRIGGKSSSANSTITTTRVFTSKTPINAAISRITVNHEGTSDNSITINNITLTVATESSFRNASLVDSIIISKPSISVNTSGSISFTPNQYSPKWAKGCYYRITIQCKISSTSNQYLKISSIQFEGDANGPENFTWLSSSLSNNADGKEVGTVTAGDAPITIAFGAGTGVTPTYNATQKAVLLKVRNQITVSAPEGYAINGITVHHTGNTNAFTPSIGTCTNKGTAPDGSKYAQKWTGLSPHVTLTWSFDLNNFYIYRIHVSYIPLTSAGSIKVKQFGTATYCPCETPLVVGDGTLTMMATGTTEESVITEENIPVVPVGTGVLIHGANQTYNCYTSADLSIPSTATLNRNLLTGVTETDGISAPVGSYVLQNHSDEGFGFYQVNDIQPSVDQGKAYLTLPLNAANARVIYFTQEDADQHATAIQATAADNAPTDGIYHLSGIRLSKLQKGLNIIRRPDGTVIKKVLP
ncbi:MAG: hypothetical protein IJP75_05565 [Bacteroidaceae bacterium]|nr:hypothetical protein [Bacteroidaceae bacterium]